MEILCLIIALVLGSYFFGQSKMEKYDIRNYYKKAYCEQRQVGKDMIKKCYDVVEIKE